VKVKSSHQTKAVAGPVRLSDEEIAFVRSLVIYEDEAVLALNKPAGLSSQGGRGQVHTLDELLWAFAKRNGNRPRLVHRLDRDTSGVILTAKTKPAAGALGKALMGRRGFQKTYVALVAPGPPEPPHGAVSAPLRRVEIGREAYMQVCAAEDEGAQAALSRYRTLAKGEGGALLELSPETGRMHQLRVHLAHLGRPILGDARYGGALMAAGAPVPRLMLHAAALGFPHPEGRKVRIEAEPPADFKATAERLKIVL
jgi:tRNA pseudouridine32 synthase/23S rRNA pseudouridine746 synthase